MKLCVIGYAGSGKDTVCEILRDAFDLRFVSATEVMIDNIIAPSLGCHAGKFTELAVKQQLLRTKNEWRTLWFELTRYYNKDDPARHIKNVMRVSDIYCGVRDKRELDAAKDEKLFDLVLWVDSEGRTGTEPGSSMTVSRDDADVSIKNFGPEKDLFKNIMDVLQEEPLLFDFE